MSGFSFSLKNNKVTKDNKKKFGVTLPNKLSNKSLPKKNSLFGEGNDASQSKTLIDGFHAKDGAMSGTTAVSKPRALIIGPVDKTHTLLKRKLGKISRDEDTLPSIPNMEDDPSLSVEDRARKSVLQGEIYSNSTSAIISGSAEDEIVETAPEDYESVPVDQFGAALLRGMGWSGEPETQDPTKKDIHNRQQGAVLGIGAKAIGKELEDELLSKKNLSVPLIRRSEQ